MLWREREVSSRIRAAAKQNGRVLENALLLDLRAHQLIEARVRAAQHEGDVAGVKHDALGLAGRSRRVDDGHRVVIGVMPRRRSRQRRAPRQKSRRTALIALSPPSDAA